MLPFVLRRSGSSILTLFALVLLTFVAVRAAPGGPARVLLGPDRYTRALEMHINRRLGLDRPLPVQLARWVAGALHGDLGDSYFYRRPARQVVLQRLPATIELGGLAFLLSVGLGVPLGVWAAVRRGSWADRVVGGGAVALMSTPGFWLGIGLILIFSAWLRWLPSAGMAPIGRAGTPLERGAHLILPLLTLAAAHAASLALYARTAMVDALASPCIQTARAAGLGDRRIVWRHAFRLAAIPVLTIAGLSVSHLLEGNLFVETVFAWPGIGQLTVASVSRRDYPVLLVVALIVGVAVVLANLLTDLAYHWIDPRLAYE